MIEYSLIIMIMIVGFLPMLWEIHNRNFDLFNMKNPFIIYYVMQLAISGAITIFTGKASDIGLDPTIYSIYYIKALMVSLLGIMFFQYGYYSEKGYIKVLPKLLEAKWLQNRTKLISYSFILIGTLSAIVLVNINGGLEVFLAEREQWRTSGLVSQGIYIFPATGMLSLAALLYFLTAVKNNAVKKWKVVTIYIIALLPACVFGFRSAIFLPILQLMVVWNYTYKRLKCNIVIILGLLIVTLFSFYGIVREIPSDFKINTTQIIDAVVKNPEIVYAVVSRSKGTEVVAAVIKDLQETGNYDLGWKSFIEAATILMPKSLWEGKPQPSGVRFTTYFFGSSLAATRGVVSDEWGGVSPTIVGELYWHFGYFGVIIGLYILGRIGKLIYCTYIIKQNNESLQLFYPIVYTTFAMFAESIQGYLNGFIMLGTVLTIMLFVLVTPVYPKR